MNIVLIIVCSAIFCALFALWMKRRNQNRALRAHSITPDALNQLLSANHEVLLFDVRRPLDLLIDLEIIPGSTRIAPNDLFHNPSLIPSDKDLVFYCTCPGDDTSRRVVQQALRMGFSRSKLLLGGLPAWKAKGYPLETYKTPFHLDIRTG
jgi:rhodanese-related sulfurtransferase